MLVTGYANDVRAACSHYITAKTHAGIATVYAGIATVYAGIANFFETGRPLSLPSGPFSILVTGFAAYRYASRFVHRVECPS